MKPTILFLASFIALTSCSKAVLLYYGVKDPKIENYDSLSKFLDKKDVDLKQIYVFKDSTSIFSRMNGQDSLFSAGLDIPEAYFFDADGVSFDYKDPSLSCNSTVDSFILNLPKEHDFPSNNDISIHDLLKDIVDLKSSHQVSFSDLPPSDFYIVMTWAKYVGKVNDDHTFAWLKLVQDNPKVKIHPILLNCDFMEFWQMQNLDIKI